MHHIRPSILMQPKLLFANLLVQLIKFAIQLRSNAGEFANRNMQGRAGQNIPLRRASHTLPEE
eukprot:2704234-Amphidinium_carterae.1